MKLNRWLVLPAVGLAAAIIGVAAVQAAPSPSPSGSKNYAQVFVDKLAGILHMTTAQTQDALKQAELQTVDQMLKDGKITQQQADAMKARINAGQGLGFGFGRHEGGGFRANRQLMHDLMTAEANAVASALHMSLTDIQSALRSGKSLSDLETQQNVSDATVKAAMKNAAKGVLDNAVKAGTITQAQADSILSRVGSGLNFRFHKHEQEQQTPGGQSPSTPTPTPSQSQSPAVYYPSI